MRRSIRLVLAGLVVSAMPIGSVSAQSPFIRPGLFVRVPGIGQATVSSQTADSLYLILKSGVGVALPNAQVPVIQIRGDKDRGAGAIRGGWIGGAIGLALGVSAWIAGDSAACGGWNGLEEYDCQRKTNVGDAIGIGLGGAMLGAGIGALVGRREWNTVRLSAPAPAPAPTTASFSVLPGRRTVLTVRVGGRSRNRSLAQD